MDKPQENRVLGIISIVLGVVAMVFSWIPFINNMAAVIAIIGLILGIVALIINRKHKKLMAWLGVIFSAVAFGIVLMTQSAFEKSFDDTFDTTSSSENSSKKSENAEKVSTKKSDDPSDRKWTLKNNVFDAGNMTYKITKSELMDSAAEDGSKTLVLHMDVTNNAKKNMDPSNVYMVLHAFQKNDTSRVELNPGTVALDENGNSPIQSEEDALNNDLLPSKTAQVAVSFDLKNTNDVEVEFSNSDFKVIGTKTYKVQ